MTPADLIQKYIQLRNRKTDIENKHKEELAPYVHVMSEIETQLLKHLQDTKLDSVNGPAGTAFKQLSTSVTVDNWTQTLEHIQQNHLWDLLEARVAKKAAMEVIETTGKAIPGVKISQATVLRVRAG